MSSLPNVGALQGTSTPMVSLTHTLTQLSARGKWRRRKWQPRGKIPTGCQMTSWWIHECVRPCRSWFICWAVVGTIEDVSWTAFQHTPISSHNLWAPNLLCIHCTTHPRVPFDVYTQANNNTTNKWGDRCLLSDMIETREFQIICIDTH